MPLLPNEILDQIWLERCKLGFEPRILQVKWVRDGRLAVPSFYTAQPQAAMTQLCHGSRQVAAKGFYSRISDNPSTGHGGFWWHEKDVLYVDQDFYRMFPTPQMAIFMGREHITRVAFDVQIDARATAITKLLLEWFPRLSQVFCLCAARLIPASQYNEYRDFIADLLPTPAYHTSLPRRSRRGRFPPQDISYPPQFHPVDIESASTKLLPITTFCKVRYQSVSMISSALFVRAQGLTDELRATVRRLPFYVREGIPFFIFCRDDSPPVIKFRKSLKGGEVVQAQEDSMTLEEVEDYLASNNRQLVRRQLA